MLQKNLERLLLDHTETCRDVISQLTGTMTPEQVQSLIERTNGELQLPKSAAHQLSAAMSSGMPIQGIMKKPSSSTCPPCTPSNSSSLLSAAEHVPPPPPSHHLAPQWSHCCNECGALSQQPLPSQQSRTNPGLGSSELFSTPVSSSTSKSKSSSHLSSHNQHAYW